MTCSTCVNTIFPQWSRQHTVKRWLNVPFFFLTCLRQFSHENRVQRQECLSSSPPPLVVRPTRRGTRGRHLEPTLMLWLGIVSYGAPSEGGGGCYFCMLRTDGTAAATTVRLRCVVLPIPRFNAPRSNVVAICPSQ